MSSVFLAQLKNQKPGLSRILKETRENIFFYVIKHLTAVTANEKGMRKFSDWISRNLE